jgi:acyl carrier protein
MDKVNLNKIIEIVSKNTGIPAKDININSKSDDFDKWDSFAHVKIILDIEKVLKKSVSAGKIGNVNSIKSMLNLIN